MKTGLLAGAAAFAIAAVLSSAAQANPYGHGGAGAAANPDCPQGPHPFDGCNNPGGTFQNASLIQDYAKDASGNPAVLLTLPPQNIPGMHFKTGPNPPGGIFIDPEADPQITQYLHTWANATGHTITTTLYLDGPGPQVGMILWDDPNGGQQYYPNGPKITAVTPTGTNLYSITTDQALTTHNGFKLYAAWQRGCYHTPGTGTGPNIVTCDFRNSAASTSVTFPNYNLSAYNGHEATVWRISGNTATVHFTNPKIVMDPHMDVFGGVFVQGTGTSLELQVDNMEFDGGDEAVPVGACHANAACMTYLQQVLSFNWAASGTATTPEHIVFTNPYIHDTAGNTIALQTAYTHITVQSPVWFNWGMNNGDLNGCTPPNCATSYHGSAIQFGGTAPGYENYAVHIYNPVFIWPYHFNGGITSCATCVLGGVGTVGTFDDIDIESPTVVSNVSNNTAGGNHAISELMFNPFRIGRIKSYKIHGVYSTNLGIVKCFGAGGDLQAGPTASSVTNGDGKSATVTFTSLTGSPGTLPYPGQWINNIDSASHATRWVANTVARNLGDGTSVMTITGAINGSTAALAFGQGLGAKLINPHSTIVSGSGSSYIISDGTGAGGGETTASEVFVAANYLNAFGTGGTTAHQPPPVGNLNGTYKVDGFLAAASNGLWAAQNAALDNLATIDTDISDNHVMTISGSGNAMTFDDVGGQYGACPGTSPA